MPADGFEVWPEMAGNRAKNFCACSGLEEVRGLSGFFKLCIGDQNAKVIAQRPEAVVEKPVGCFRQCDPIGGMAVSASFELVDVCGVERG